MTTITNDFETSASGTTLTNANAGGTGDTNFNFVNLGTGTTNAFDNAHAMHGSQSCKIATPATAASAYNQWSTNFTGQPFGQVWFRGYYYFTANPGANHKIMSMLTGAAAACMSMYLSTTGKLLFTNAAGSTVITGANSVPLNAWWRVEGYVIGSATVGQVSFSLWSTSPDSSGTADETQTTALTMNTGGTIEYSNWGVPTAVSSAGPFWMDDIGVSSTAYLGPSGSGSTSPNAGLAAATGVPPALNDSVTLNMTIQGV